MGADKDEFPPLLPAGFCKKTLGELRAFCVMEPRFKASRTRPDLMTRLERVIARLAEEQIRGEVWVDGSFLTQKIDPEDIDISLRIDGDFYDNASPSQRAAMDWVTEIWDCEKIDGYLHFEWPEGHPAYEVGQENYRIWKKQWGFSRRGIAKGIVVLELPEGDS